MPINIKPNWTEIRQSIKTLQKFLKSKEAEEHLDQLDIQSYQIKIGELKKSLGF